MRKVLCYLGFSVLIYVMFFEVTSILFHVAREGSVTYRMTPAIYLTALFYMMAGVGFGIERFFKEMRKSGAIKFDWIRMIIFRLPSLYLTLATLPHTSQYFFLPNFLLDSRMVFGYDTFYLTKMFLGYIFITSFRKEIPVATDEHKITSQGA